MAEDTPLAVLCRALRERDASYSMESSMELDYSIVVELRHENRHFTEVARWTFNYRGTEALDALL